MESQLYGLARILTWIPRAGWEAHKAGHHGKRNQDPLKNATQKCKNTKKATSLHLWKGTPAGGGGRWLLIQFLLHI